MALTLTLRNTALLAGLTMLSAVAFAQRAPVADDSVLQIPQSAPGTPWSFIGYGITTPATSEWFVTTSTPRGGTMGRTISGAPPHSAILVVASELLEQAVESDMDLLTLARARHARLGERWTLSRHDETIVRHAGTRCARHELAGRESEESPGKEGAPPRASRSHLHVTGLSCIHPTEPRLLVEIGLSERSPRDAMGPGLRREVEQAIASLAFQRYSEQALQKAAELARAGSATEAEALLRPYVEADAAWARYFLAQIVERAVPPPKEAGLRLKALLEPAAERGLTDAQWSLGTLYLRGAPGLPRNPALAEALLRRAAERGNPGAGFQLGVAQLTGSEGISRDERDGLIWVTRAAARGQKEAQELLKSVRDSLPARADPTRSAPPR